MEIKSHLRQTLPADLIVILEMPDSHRRVWAMAERLNVPLQHIEKGMFALKLHCQGKTGKEIATEMGLSYNMTSKYSAVATRAIGARSKKHAREIAAEFGLFD